MGWDFYEDYAKRKRINIEPRWILWHFAVDQRAAQRLLQLVGVAN